MSNWTSENNKLYRKLIFKDFLQAMLFMQNAMPVIEKMQHHPEWRNVYNVVEVWLCTHDAGNIVTEKDHLLSSELDKIYHSIVNQ